MKYVFVRSATSGDGYLLECESCSADVPLSLFHKNALEDQKAAWLLCNVCASSHISSLTSYAHHRDNKDIAQAIACVGNMILEAVGKFKDAETIVIPDETVERNLHAEFKEYFK